MKFRAVSFIAFAGMLSSEFLFGAGTPVTITSALKGTIGVAASTSQLLFTQPFCTTTGVTRGVYSVNTTTGVPTLYAALPELAACTEDYLALSTGSGGFTAGATYVTQGATIYVVPPFVPPGPGSATPLTITGDALTAPFGHSGIGFDTVGTFGFELIFTSSDGVWLISSAGVSTKIAASIGTNVYMESPAVAPSSGFGTTFGGYLFLTAEDESAGGGTGPKSGVYYIAPGANPASAPTAFVGMQGSAPEAIQFVPQTACSLTIKGTPYQGFSSVYSQSTVGQDFPTDSAIVGFPTSNFTKLRGQAIVTYEYAKGATYNGVSLGAVDDLESMTSGGTLTSFNNLPLQLEGFNLITCNVPLPPQPPPSGGCPATQGFWHKAANWPAVTATVDGIVYNGATDFSMVIGGITYTQTELLQVMPSGGLHSGNYANSLSQLIAAVLNVAAGAQHTISGDAAIASDNTALAGVQIFCSAGLNTLCSVSSTVVSAVQANLTGLDNYNSALGLGCTEGAGLTIGSGKTSK